MTPDELKQKRRCNIIKALQQSNTTNILKGLNTFIERKTKQAEQKNKLINGLLKMGCIKIFIINIAIIWKKLTTII